MRNYKLVALWLALLLAGGSISASLAADSEGDMRASLQRPSARLDPEMSALLEEFRALGPKPLTSLNPEQARKQPTIADAVKALLKKQQMSDEPEGVASVENRTIPSKEGKIPVRIYTPQGSGPFPILVYYHGGGWVIADLDVYDSTPRALANAANCLVVSVAYRQAPENKFPAAPQDAFEAYKWVVDNAKELGGDPKRVAVGGESAGGNLAAVTAMMARDDGVQLPVHQLLVYPVTSYRFDSESLRSEANAEPLNTAMMRWFWEFYLARPEDGLMPYASPLHSKNLEKLPAATIVTAEVDPLRSDGKEYAEKLQAAGVNVVYKNYEGVTHEFFGTGAVVPKAKEAVEFAAQALKTSFRQ